MGRKAEADANFARSIALKPAIKESLEERVKILQANNASYTEGKCNHND